MQRVFKYGNTQNISVTPDKELNIFIYRTPSYIITHRHYKLFKTSPFLAHPIILIQHRPDLMDMQTLKICNSGTV